GESIPFSRGNQSRAVDLASAFLAAPARAGAHRSTARTPHRLVRHCDLLRKRGANRGMDPAFAGKRQVIFVSSKPAPDFLTSSEAATRWSCRRTYNGGAVDCQAAFLRRRWLSPHHVASRPRCANTSRRSSAKCGSPRWRGYGLALTI